jgi:hypothetical protein
MKSDLLDLDMQIHVETGKAVLASTSGEKDQAVWLPLSQIEIERKGDLAVVTMPEWLAVDKELV